MLLKLKDIYLGENDGKKEAVYKSDFERYFIDRFAGNKKRLKTLANNHLEIWF